MINNNEDILEYKEYNKLYIPTNYINQNYIYRFNGDYITIITNNNCQTQYNTTYCDCYNYNYKNNVISTTNTCNTNSNNTQTIPFESITDNINYSLYIKEQFTSNYLMYFLILILAILLVGIFTKERKCL